MGRPDPSCPPPKPTLSPRAQPDTTMLSLVEFGFGLVLILKHMGSPANISQIIPMTSLIKLSEISHRPRVEVTS